MENVSTAQILIVLIQILMMIVSLIGASMLNSMRDSIKELKDKDAALAEDLKTYAKQDELREWRREHREEMNQWRVENKSEIKQIREEQNTLFGKVFEKLDNLQEKLINKADRV